MSTSPQSFHSLAWGIVGSLGSSCGKITLLGERIFLNLFEIICIRLRESLSLPACSLAAARDAGEPKGKSPGLGIESVASAAPEPACLAAIFVLLTGTCCNGNRLGEPSRQNTLRRICFQLGSGHPLEQLVEIDVL